LLGWLLACFAFLLACLDCFDTESRLGGDVFEMLERLLISHWNESKERAHSDSRKVVVEIPYPLRSDNLLTCLMSLTELSFAIVAINSF
jgi:hypothetical protein